MRRHIAAFAAAAGILAALAPLGARAEHTCQNRLIVFSSPLGLNTNALRCIADPTDDVPYDGRLINPGSTGVLLRYIPGGTGGDLGVEEITTTLDGLGFDGFDVTLTKADVFGAIVYDSDIVDIPDGPTAMGCLTGTVALPDGASDGDAYHTLGSACP